MSMKEALIKSDDDNPPSPSYGADDEKEDEEERISKTSGKGSRSTSGRKKAPRKLQERALGKVDENAEYDSSEDFKKSKADMSFGVKSYLHNFYEPQFYKDPNMYEEDDDLRYLLQPYPRQRKCGSIWWKIFVWIGANFLIFGIIGVLVGYLVPEKQILIKSLNNNIDVIDRAAMSYNFNLNVCKLVGLILFCIGGLTLTVALLFPSFLYQYFDEDRIGDGSFGIRASEREPRTYTEEQPASPLEKNIPVSGIVKSVQPERKSNEAVFTKDGMVPYKD